MICGHPRFFYVELAESRLGHWHLRWLDSGLVRWPQDRYIQARTLEEAEHRAELILDAGRVFTGLDTLVARSSLDLPSIRKPRGDGNDGYTNRGSWNGRR